MSKCTRAQALESFEYWLQNGGYHEKADGTAKYLTRDLANFAANAGSGNWTYMGKLCGVNPGAWCAMMNSTAIHEACGGVTADAKAVLWGVWPYTVVKQVWNAADDDHRFYGDYQRFTLGKGVRTRYTPIPADIIIFTDDKGKTLTHTGMVYAVDDTYVYTMEGNSSNMCRKRSYRRDSSYIYGYVVPDYADGETPSVVVDQYGAEIVVSVKRHVLSKGCAGPEVKELQGRLGEAGYIVDCDGEFGPQTKAAVIAYQTAKGLAADGIVGVKTWAALL